MNQTKRIMTALVCLGLSVNLMANQQPISLAQETTAEVDLSQSQDKAFYHERLKALLQDTVEIESQSNPDQDPLINWLDLEQNVMLSKFTLGKETSEVYEWNDGYTGELTTAALKRFTLMSPDLNQKAFLAVLDQVGDKYLIVEHPENKGRVASIPDLYYEIIEQLSHFDAANADGIVRASTDPIVLKDSAAFNMMSESYGPNGTVTHHVIYDRQANSLTFQHEFVADPDFKPAGPPTSEASNTSINNQSQVVIRPSDKVLAKREDLDTIAYQELVQLCKDKGLNLFEETQE